MSTETQEVVPSNALVRALLAGLDKAVQVGRPAIHAHVRATVRRHPDATPEEVIQSLGREFTTLVAMTGAAAGGGAAAPGFGLPAGIALGAADATAFTTVAMTYVLAVAEVYDIPTEDVVRRRTLLLGIMLGDAATPVITKAAGRTGAHWGRKVVQSVPLATLRKVNRVLGRNFVTKYGTKQGILVLGKSVPFGIGAVIGGAGNAAYARFTIRSTRNAFGPPPSELPAHLRAGGDGGDPDEDGDPVDVGVAEDETLDD